MLFGSGTGGAIHVVRWSDASEPGFAFGLGYVPELTVEPWILSVVRLWQAVAVSHPNVHNAYIPRASISSQELGVDFVGRGSGHLHLRAAGLFPVLRTIAPERRDLLVAQASPIAPHRLADS